MTFGKSGLIATGTLLLILASYAVNSAFSEKDTVEGNSSRFSQIFSGSDESLEQRVKNLEAALEKSEQIQTQLLDLMDDLRHQMEGYPTNQLPGEEVSTEIAEDMSEAHQRDNSRQARYTKYRNMQLQKLIDAGLNPDRAEFILDKQERFQYEHMQLSYQYRHQQDKGSEQARALQEQLRNYSHPRKMLEHELSPQEFELYLESSGHRQEMQVDRIVDNTPAASAGLRPGDKIISYNGERIFHMGDLRNQIYRVAPGETVTIEVQREGSSSTETLYVPSGPLGIQG